MPEVSPKDGITALTAIGRRLVFKSESVSRE
jgi:hypothetical protein